VWSLRRSFAWYHEAADSVVVDRGELAVRLAIPIVDDDGDGATVAPCRECG
jgi:hypothetical protein